MNVIDELKRSRLRMLEAIAIIDEAIEKHERIGEVLLQNTLLHAHTQHTLLASGVKTLKQLSFMTDRQISNIEGLDKKGYNEIKHYLQKNNIHIIDGE